MALLRKRGEASSKPRLTRANTKRYLGVASVIAPALAPLAFRAAAVTRDRWDRMRANRLGVPVDRLPEFTGKGAALHVRLSGLATSVAELRAGHPEQAAFAEETQRRLADLASAVRAAEQMPSARRRAAHQAVATELDTLEHELLTRLGV